jgi:phosphoribosylanthranilate isomerase
MTGIWIKICGVTREQDARLAVQLGADAIGFVFWPGSPRFISPAQAAPIIASLPPSVAAVGVFVNATLDEIERVTALAGLTAIQLHGEESRDTWTRTPKHCIKAVAVDEHFDARSIEDWPARVVPLLDAGDAGARGGTGRTINWSIAATAARVRPIVLAGGLTPENVGEAMRIVRPYGLDVSSGVESAPGVKDAGRLTAYFRAVAAGVEGWQR